MGVVWRVVVTGLVLLVLGGSSAGWAQDRLADAAVAAAGALEVTEAQEQNEDAQD